MEIKIKHNMVPIPDYMSPEEIFPKADFIKLCQCAAFIDYDGFGEYSDGELVLEKGFDNRITPSQVIAGKFNHDFTHVLWYNR
jgi:hypothetical protein